MTYVVQVINRKTKQVVKEIPCGGGYRYAERVLRGVSLNMSEDYRARIVEKKEKRT